MPTLTLEEVRQHRSKDDLWVVHNDKVYEVTDFAGRHPGGAKLLLGRGGQEIDKLMTDPKSHAHSQFAYQILNKFYIGDLCDNNNDQQIKINGMANGSAHGHKNRGTERPPAETGGKTMLGWREEELVDWDKPILGQVGKLGKDYLEWVHSPVDKHVRLFESDFLEYFADNYWWYIPVIWLPVTFFFLYTSATYLTSYPEQLVFGWLFGGMTMTMGKIPAAFVFGLLFWTFTEYTLHRWLFHLPPPENSPFLITFHFLLHGQHHKAPFDKYRLVFPPALTIVFVAFFYFWAHQLLPPSGAYAVLAGMMLGYICYDITHYYLHHGTPLLAYFKGLKQYHIKHHFINQQKGFGISSRLWDYPFGTVLPDDGKYH